VDKATAARRTFIELRGNIFLGMVCNTWMGVTPRMPQLADSPLSKALVPIIEGATASAIFRSPLVPSRDVAPDHLLIIHSQDACKTNIDKEVLIGHLREQYDQIMTKYSHLHRMDNVLDVLRDLIPSSKKIQTKLQNFNLDPVLEEEIKACQETVPFQDELEKGRELCEEFCKTLASALRGDESFKEGAYL
jgi:hypothetical protein